MITVSIISSAYNCVDRLRRHIESVRNQTFRSIEHIIVDNMSSDGTEELVMAYQREADYPVTYIRDPDRGTWPADNKGIRRARGEWVHLLHADNTYSSARVLEEVFARDFQALDLVACGEILVKNGKEIYMKPEYDAELRDYRFPHQGVLIRKSFYEKHGLLSERFRVISDHIFKYRNYPKARWGIVDVPLAVSPGGGISGTPSLLMTYETVVMYLFFHNYPLRLKLYWAAFNVYCYLRNQLSCRRGETS